MLAPEWAELPCFCSGCGSHNVTVSASVRPGKLAFGEGKGLEQEKGLTQLLESQPVRPRRPHSGIWECRGHREARSFSGKCPMTLSKPCDPHTCLQLLQSIKVSLCLLPGVSLGTPGKEEYRLPVSALRRHLEGGWPASG